MTTRKKAAIPPPAGLQTLLEASPDLVDRIFDYVVELLPEIAPGRVAELKAAAREEFAGERCYINERSPTDRQQLVADVLALFNGRNASEVARRLNISRATVYRYIKQAGRAPA
jgi:DNA-binding NarL/FixJ family response regulator